MALAAQTLAATLPNSLVSPPRKLAETKQRLKDGDDALRPALQALQARAADALEQPPVSVVHNELLPPSGDHHDYTSVGPYWWPNPDTDDGLPYIRKDGEVNPERKQGDNVMMSRMVRAVKPLCLAYFLSENEDYARHAARLLRTWFLDPQTKMNPHLEYGQAIPGRCEGRGIGIIDTACLVDLVDRVGLLEPSTHWTEQDHAALKQWFSAYLDWLLDSSHGKSERATRNNHGSWYDAQVVAFALFAGRPDVAEKTLESAADRRLAKHIETDGRQPHELHRTKSWNYSIYNLSALMTLALLGDHTDVDLWNIDRNGRGSIGKALDYLLSFEHPETQWPHKQITRARREQLKNVLFKAVHGLNKPHYREALESLPPDSIRADESNLLFAPASM